MTAVRLNYQTIEFGALDIHICSLRDRQQFDDPDGLAENLGICSASWPIFGMIWPSSIVLANFMLNYNTDGKRILEVGCGIALTSLLLNKQKADITATDRHPEVRTYLNRNTLLNLDASIPYQRIGWEDKDSDLGLFDVIVGSDLLYEDQHINLLADFIAAHAKPNCEIVLVDPSRGRKTKLSKRMIEHGFSYKHHKPAHTDYMDDVFKGDVLEFKR